MRIAFDERALSDIANIYRLISYETPTTAGKVVRRLYASIERLPDFPDIGRPSKDPDTREWIVPKTPYLVV
jgi:toxin ParE1/3/4